MKKGNDKTAIPCKTVEEDENGWWGEETESESF